MKGKKQTFHTWVAEGRCTQMHVCIALMYKTFCKIIISLVQIPILQIPPHTKLDLWTIGSSLTSGSHRQVAHEAHFGGC